MAYIKRDIKDRNAIGDDIFTIESAGQNKIRLIPSPIEVTEPGTIINKTFLDKYEDTNVEHDRRLNGLENLTAIKSKIVDLIYPVGSIYMSVNSTSPATLFGGTWYKLEDRFLVGAGYYHSVNSTGGSRYHTHSLDTSTAIARAEFHMENWFDRVWADVVFLGDRYNWKNNNAFGLNFHDDGSKGWTHGWGTKLQGDTSSESTLPPYLAVNMWKRTA